MLRTQRGAGERLVDRHGSVEVFEEQEYDRQMAGDREVVERVPQVTGRLDYSLSILATLAILAIPRCARASGLRLFL